MKSTKFINCCLISVALLGFSPATVFADEPSSNAQGSSDYHDRMKQIEQDMRDLKQKTATEMQKMRAELDDLKKHAQADMNRQGSKKMQKTATPGGVPASGTSPSNSN